MSAELLVRIAVAMMAVALALATVRLLRGPTVPDRVVAFDLLTLHVLGMVAGTAILTEQWLFLDVAIILALMTFMATLAFARYVERRARKDVEEAAAAAEDDPHRERLAAVRSRLHGDQEGSP